MNYSLTPGKAAKDWAKAHPDAEAKVLVLSYAPKGKGGWGVAGKATEFYAAGGKAVQTRGKLLHRDIETKDGVTQYHDSTGHNGLCAVCGRIFLDCMLQWCHAPDPEALAELDQTWIAG